MVKVERLNNGEFNIELTRGVEKFYIIDECIYTDGKYYLLESCKYGEDYPSIVIKKDNNGYKVLELDCWDSLFEYIQDNVSFLYKIY